MTEAHTYTFKIYKILLCCLLHCHTKTDLKCWHIRVVSVLNREARFDANVYKSVDYITYLE